MTGLLLRPIKTLNFHQTKTQHEWLHAQQIIFIILVSIITSFPSRWANMQFCWMWIIVNTVESETWRHRHYKKSNSESRHENDKCKVRYPKKKLLVLDKKAAQKSVALKKKKKFQLIKYPATLVVTHAVCWGQDNGGEYEVLSIANRFSLLGVQIQSLQDAARCSRGLPADLAESAYASWISSEHTHYGDCQTISLKHSSNAINGNWMLLHNW